MVIGVITARILLCTCITLFLWSVETHTVPIRICLRAPSKGSQGQKFVLWSYLSYQTELFSTAEVLHTQPKETDTDSI
jgi:hypothetical protein